MAFRDTDNTPLEPKVEGHPHQQQCEVSEEGMCWPDERQEGKESEGERTWSDSEAHQDWEYYGENFLRWRF